MYYSDYSSYASSSSYGTEELGMFTGVFSAIFIISFIIALVASILVIISLAKIAPKAYENTFSNATYLNATLYVPIGSMDSYKSSTPWKNFLIEENYPTGTEDVKADNILVEKARYSLDGKMLLAPKKGINIIKMSDGTTKKVFVK